MSTRVYSNHGHTSTKPRHCWNYGATGCTYDIHTGDRYRRLFMDDTDAWFRPREICLCLPCYDRLGFHTPEGKASR